jgi:8-oxo-dGTP pyrophosphatase MutT (NUDIX family)
MTEIDTINVRHVARIVLLNQSRILLIQVALPGQIFWCTIGGGIEDGETPESAAARELREETGLVASDVKWCGKIWIGQHQLERNGRYLDHHESYFLAYSTTDVFNLQNLDAEEAKVVRRLRWWTLDELKQTSELVFP